MMYFTYKLWLPATLALLSGISTCKGDNGRYQTLEEVRAKATKPDLKNRIYGDSIVWDAGSSQGLLPHEQDIFTGKGCVVVRLYDNVQSRQETFDKDPGNEFSKAANSASPWCVDSGPLRKDMDESINEMGVSDKLPIRFGDTGRDSAFLVLGNIQGDRSNQWAVSTEPKFYYSDATHKFTAEAEEAIIKSVTESNRPDEGDGIKVLNPYVLNNRFSYNTTNADDFVFK